MERFGLLSGEEIVVAHLLVALVGNPLGAAVPSAVEVSG